MKFQLVTSYGSGLQEVLWIIIALLKRKFATSRSRGKRGSEPFVFMEMVFCIWEQYIDKCQLILMIHALTCVCKLCEITVSYKRLVFKLKRPSTSTDWTWSGCKQFHCNWSTTLDSCSGDLQGAAVDLSIRAFISLLHHSWRPTNLKKAKQSCYNKRSTKKEWAWWFERV
jgi:hypothetical protein